LFQVFRFSVGGFSFGSGAAFLAGRLALVAADAAVEVGL
jgi:hypothetical protein